eukprot:m.117323 g.117323  ORF g.117323 m.117323 type:complete len:782 (-) comp12873_c0_seq3:274-2619(-)
MILNTELKPTLFADVDEETILYLKEAIGDIDDVDDAIELVVSMVGDISKEDVRCCLSETSNNETVPSESTVGLLDNTKRIATMKTLDSMPHTPPSTNTKTKTVSSFTKEECSSSAQQSAQQDASKKSKEKRRHRHRHRRHKHKSKSTNVKTDDDGVCHNSETNDSKSKSSSDLEDDNESDLLISSEESRFALDHVGDSREVFIRGLDISFLNGASLITQSQLILSPPRVYGLIGSNGCGKSTLLKALASRKLQAFPEHISTLYIDQGASISFDRVLDYVVAGNEELIRQRVREDELLALLGDKQQSNSKDVKDISAELAGVAEQLQVLGSASAEEEAQDALKQLGFSEEMMQWNASKLSGGWRMKAALARCMYCPPQFLLLDEPNNFLDLNGVLWLQQFIKSLDDTCTIVVSHDQSFLDNITTDIIQIKNKKLHNFNGTFSAFLRDQEEKFKKQTRLYENQEKTRQRIQKTINQGIATARRTGNDKVLGMVASRKKKLNDRLGAEKREDGKRWKTNTRRDTNTLKKYESCIDGSRREIEKPIPPKPLKFKFPTSVSPLPNKRCFSIDNVSFSYTSGIPILNNVTFSLDLGQKIGILGRNGAGKSTLINLIMNKLQPCAGKIDRSRHAKIALFNQHHEEGLDLSQSALQHLKLKFGSKFKEQELRNVLGSYGIGGNKASKAMHHLSGGQKTRVSLVTIALSEPHVLIADEISNHLDFESIQALSEAINTFPGAVLIVSHDRHFMQSVAKEYWEVKDTKVQRVEVEYTTYVNAILSSSKECTI